MKEERTLFRYIALLTGCGLLAATVWISTSTRAQEEPADFDNPFAAEATESGPAAPIRTLSGTEANPFADQTAAAPAPAEPAATADEPGASLGNDALRRRVDDRMRQARRALRDGDHAEALRLASVANALAVQYKITFAETEQTPAALIAQIKGGNSASVAAIPSSVPQDVEGKQKYVQLLLSAAKEHLDAGQYEAARQKAMQAQAVDVTYDAFDLRPEHVLAEIARRQPADPNGPTESFLSSLGAKPEPVSQQPSAAFESAPQTPTERAREMLKLAREALGRQHYDEARSLALDAQKLDATYDVFEDRPETIFAEIERLTGARIITASSTAPQAPLTPEQAQERRQQAQELLKQARQALEAGDVENAREHATKAQSLNATYALLDDRPELVLEAISAGSRDRMVTQAGGPPLPTHTLAPSAEKQQALALLAEARQELKRGNYDAAREKAIAASGMDVTYNLFEDRPEALLQDLDRLAPAGDAGAVNWATGETQATSARRDNMVVTTSGGTPEELYRRGIEKLREQDRAAAYDLFLAAYNSGEQMSPHLRQQLQDKLRELSQNRGPIQQVAAQDLLSAPGHGPALAQGQGPTLAPGLGPAPARNNLDAAARQHSLKYDRTRTEVLNVIFKAERLRDSDPQQAAALLAATMAQLEESDLPPEQVKPLMKSLQNSRESVDAYIAQRKPMLDLKAKNSEVRDAIKVEMEHRVRVEQELADLVEQHNKLMKERRYGEAMVVAKKAKELDPENPVVVQLEWMAKFAYRNDRNNDTRSLKEESFWRQLDDVERAAIANVHDNHPMDFGDIERWEQVINKRQSPTDALQRTDEELRIQESLNRQVSLHFTDAPLHQVMQEIANGANINAWVDGAGIAEEGVSMDTPITINVEGVKMKSALNLILKPLNLDYTIEDEVLKITSRLRQQGELKVVVYPVADLVVPIPSHAPTAQLSPMGGNFVPVGQLGGGQMSIAGIGGPQAGQGQGFHQVTEGSNPLLMGALPGHQQKLNGPDSNYDFKGLTELITTTVNPDGWDEFGGQGSVSRHETTLSLVIRQTQRVHQEIADLLEQLRRLQDLQVTIEVRFITVSDRFFERIGIDFDFNVNDDIGGPRVDNAYVPLAPFGAVDPVNGQIGGVPAPNQQGQAGQQAGGQQGQQGQQGAQIVPPQAPFSRGPLLNLVGRDNWGDGVVVGMVDPETFSADLDIPFRQGSFELGVPEFGGFTPESGLRFGMAILSDIEAFLFVQAAQGDQRSNLMFAPKITLFNGQIGSVNSSVARPFVTSVIPVVSAFAVGFQPVIQNIQDGIFMTVQAVVSADRRYVRLSVAPFFNNVTDIFTFSFVSGAQPTIGGQGGGGGLGGGGLGGGGLGGGGGGGFGGGGGGGFGGGGFGGGGFGGGGGGIGGGGQQGQQGQQGGTGGGSITVQQPVQEIVTVSTVVSVPDGGTVLLGGVKRLREGRSMNGVPILNKIPYVSRLFKNTGVGRETESLMLMVTPRIIIQEEEEELLGQ
jgi:general secretion pathway protein D